ncbi:MAG: hypothetical protein PHC66_00240 [Candidatus Nanoarchaeia archaeon]|nr:hypothetical protein [Candidatus Nanoarchaeia archaeon]MDD5239622.1 hypothetical protein [Candidatus Nanoarchaeia archaeon]
MVNKLLLLGTLLVAAIVILGCTSQKTTAETPAPIETAAPETRVDILAPPVYEAPLDQSKFTLSCEKTSDCKLVDVKTGSGNIEQCMNADTEYQGVASDKCTCKYIGTTEQSFPNDTIILHDNYECRHI